MMNTLSWWLIVLAVICWSVTLTSLVVFWKISREHHDKIEKRLQEIRPHFSDLERFAKRRLSQIDVLDRWLESSTLAKKMDHRLLVAGSKQSLDVFAGMIINALFFANFLLLLVNSSGIWHLIVSLAIVFLPIIYLHLLIKRRSNLLELQLPDVLDFISRAMQAGHSFSVAMQMAASEAPEPIKAEFSKTQSELNFGIPAQKALGDLADRMDSTDLRFFVIAVIINREVGGDLSSLLNNLSSIIRNRLEMRASILALSAEGRLSAVILNVLPFLIGLVLYWIQPQIISVLWKSEIGLDLLTMSLVLMGLGIFWMSRIIRIKV
jgi:tight adherence protein B